MPRKTARTKPGSKAKKKTTTRRRGGAGAAALDREIDHVLADRTAALLTPANAELSALVALAAELRGLPRAAFRRALGEVLRGPLAARDLREESRTLAVREDRPLGSLDRATVLISRFQGLTPWERHPDGDELIVVLDGGGEVIVLTDGEPVRTALRPGGLFVCPKGLWHRTHAQPEMVALYVTPLAGGEHSNAEDPRRGAGA